MSIRTTTLIKMATIAQEYRQPFSEVVAGFSADLSYHAACKLLGFAPTSGAMRQYKHLFTQYKGSGKHENHHVKVLNKTRARRVEGKLLSEIAAENLLTYAMVAQRYRKGARTILDLTKPYIRKFNSRKAAAN
ncbi:MAG: hypothetical protein JHC38_00890 [Thiotrichales bacterium]|jgi:hypothetical protein|nr:hypothetical protein [Thiotrichales bacterium]